MAETRAAVVGPIDEPVSRLRREAKAGLTHTRPQLHGRYRSAKIQQRR